MKRNACKPRRSRSTRRRGAMIILIAFMLIAFVVTLALSVDIAYMQLTKTELRTATDAAARAAAEAISREQDEDAAIAAAKRIAAMNTVAGEPLLLRDSDIVLGTSRMQSDGTWKFTPGGDPVNAVQINGRRTQDSLSGPVNLFFGGLLGTSTFEPTQVAVASQLDRDVCIVMDRSGSMAWDLSDKDWSYPSPYKYPDAYCQAPHPTGSRWAAAASAVDVFLNEIARTPQKEQVSFVTYASPGTWCDTKKNAADIEIQLTPNYTAVRSAVSRVSSKPIPGGTSISSGIDLGIVTLINPVTSRKHAVKTLIVLTDGVHNHGRAPIESAYEAKRQNITIHTITFSNGADQDQMRAVAQATGGKHYHAPDADALRRIFREIAATLPVVLTE